MRKSDNYKPWEIDVADFPITSNIENQIKFLLGFGILAPSGHNSQPWKFKIYYQNVDIFIERIRSLEKSDPAGKQLCISIGCLIENIILAAEYFGFAAQVKYLNDTKGDGPIASIQFSKIETQINDPNHLIHCIKKRGTNRNKYKLYSLPLDFNDTIERLSTDQIKITAINQPQLIQDISDIIIQAQILSMEKPYFRKELSELMKPNFTVSKVGMPGFVFNIPLPISIFSSWMIKKLNMSKLNKKQDEKIFKNFTPAFIIISLKNETKENWMLAGRMFEKVWLIATKFNLKCSPNAAPIQEDISRQALQKLLNSSFMPITLMRVGYCDKNNQHTPRISVSELLI